MNFKFMEVQYYRGNTLDHNLIFMKRFDISHMTVQYLTLGSHPNVVLNSTRGSIFWSSKVCEGGESREACACKLISPVRTNEGGPKVGFRTVY